MAKTSEIPVLPNRGLLAAFNYEGGELIALGDQDVAAQHLVAAQASLSVWAAAQRLTDAALMIVKDGDNISIGTVNGGIIAEGKSTLNIGLFRAATRSLPAVTSGAAIETHMTSEDRFRRSAWTVMSRLHTAVLPRCFQFNFGGVKGKITVNEGRLSFSGDFLTPQDFILELSAACEIDEEVKYSLGPVKTHPKGKDYALSELIQQLAPAAGYDACVFDAEGWPVSCAVDVDFATIQILSNIAKALHSKIGQKGETKISVMSSSNASILSGAVHADGFTHFNHSGFFLS